MCFALNTRIEMHNPIYFSCPPMRAPSVRDRCVLLSLFPLFSDAFVFVAFVSLSRATALPSRLPGRMSTEFSAANVRVAMAFVTGLVVGGTSLYVLRRTVPSVRTPSPAPAAAAASAPTPASAGDMALVIKAAAFAAVAHRDQRRKNQTAAPYIEHPLGVAALLAETGFTHPPTLAAAILHDTVEDTAVTLEELVAVFGPEVGTCISLDSFREQWGGVSVRLTVAPFSSICAVTLLGCPLAAILWWTYPELSKPLLFPMFSSFSVGRGLSPPSCALATCLYVLAARQRAFPRAHSPRLPLSPTPQRPLSPR